MAGTFEATLSALGNHEGKALTYLAMQPGEPYGISALHALFLAIQGNRPAFVGTVTLQQKYCTYSFEPAGLVERGTGTSGFLRHTRTDARGMVTALAGHVLSATEDHPASLGQIFGKTAAKTELSATGDRPPVRRLAVMRALAANGRIVHEADVARRAGVRDLTVGQIAQTWSKVGLVSFRTAPTYELKSRYEVRQPVVVRERGNLAFERAVADYLNLRLSRGGIVVVERDEIESHLRTLPRWQHTPRLRDTVQKVMARLSAAGRVVPLETFTGQTNHTVIDVDPAQERFLRTLVDGLDRIQAGDADAVAEGVEQGRRIVADPDRVRRLLARGYGATKNVVNPVSRAEKRRRVLELLVEDHGVTTKDLTTRLAPDLGPNLVRGTLSELARDGAVRGEKQPDGPYKLWYRV